MILNTFNTEDKIWLIAEIGINHDGRKEVATRLIEEASRAGVDSIKFQYRNLSRINSYSFQEIGDQNIAPEISRNYLSPETILELSTYAKGLGLTVGISFFSVSDVTDFAHELDVFDFYKVPSVELLNLELIEFLIDTNKTVLISTGAHHLKEINSVLRRLNGKNWVPLYCVSNYPLAAHNIELEKLLFLKKYGHGVGYSSHDARWETILLTLNYGVSVIERHIRTPGDLSGLDKSSSSTPEEFALLAEYLKVYPHISKNVLSESPNQGELINRQNLGQSFYAADNLKKGEQLQLNKLIYRTPQVGIHRGNIEDFLGKALKMDVFKGDPLVISNFKDFKNFDSKERNLLNSAKIGIPVRCHDFLKIRDLLGLDTVEFHLDYNEIAYFEKLSVADFPRNVTVHLPDYVSSVQLMDPFSENKEVRMDSLRLISRIVACVAKMQNEFDREIMVTGSFPTQSLDSKLYFNSLFNLISKYRNEYKVNIYPQWLPPFAWYFGGSVRLCQFNSLEAIDLINEYGIDICLDTSHFMLSSNFYGYDVLQAYHSLRDRVAYFHLGGASGIDGEGKGVNEFLDTNKILLEEVLFSDQIKICEVWQGHLDNFNGFRNTLDELTEILRGKNV